MHRRPIRTFVLSEMLRRMVLEIPLSAGLPFELKIVETRRLAGTIFRNLSDSGDLMLQCQRLFFLSSWKSLLSE